MSSVIPLTFGEICIYFYLQREKKLFIIINPFVLLTVVVPLCVVLFLNCFVSYYNCL